MNSTTRFKQKALLLAAATPFVIALGAAPGFAQAADPGTQTQTPGQVEINQQQTDASTPDAQATTPNDIVVTGSLLRRTNTETASPVTVLTSDTLAKAGVTTVSDAIRSVSADSAGSIPTGFQGGFSAGGSAVSLRGLGVSSTLVLIDGLRSTNFPLNDDGHNAYVDLNSIPFSAVERVEVLKDGASSTYGADAIGGVVNVILKKQFTGVAGTVEAGIAEGGYAPRQRANLTAGFGDYADKGFNFYVNGEYQRDGRASVADVGFPNNTTDLSSLGLTDNNSADSSLTTATINGQVVRVQQNDLNNPFAGGTLIPSGTYISGTNPDTGMPIVSPFYNFTSLTPTANCPRGTFTVTGGTNRGVGCAHDNTREYVQVQPLQEKYSGTARLSLRLGDNIESYLLGSYSHSQVNILGAPAAIRQRQPYGASPNVSSLNPGIVLPVYVCSSGVNCSIAADRRLNPNNPYAAAFAGNPAAGAARIYYTFGDIPVGSERGNDVYRVAGGLNGTFGDGFGFRIEGVYARDNLEYTSFGVPSIAGIQQVVSQGTYNFINPALNSDAIRQVVSPDITAKSHTTLASLDASVTKDLFQLPGGVMQLAVGGQVRRETLVNNSLNPDLSNYANTAAAFGKHTVSAAYFELNAPILDQLEVNASGRYDHYSEGFDHFSPKVGAKFTPFQQLAIRGTYSEGFRAPTFAESNPASSFPGFVNYQPPDSFVAAHGGPTNPYSQAYNIGGGFSGNPNLRPETSRSFTAGVIVQPVRWLSLTADYYNVKKKDVIVAGPLAGTARANYYAGIPLPDGYSVAAVDAVDPLYPNALPRVLVINGPYVNSGFFKTEGLDFSATATVPLGNDIRFISRVDVSDIFKFNVDFGDGVLRKYVGTIGPYELSSGAGTPKFRGNWQNTIEAGPFSLTATAYYVSRIKQVAADEENPGADGTIDLSCAAAAGDLYQYPNAGARQKFCYIKDFLYADLNGSVKVNDNFTFFVNVGNFTNAHAPLAPASYSGTNYLPTWHYAGVIGRTFRAGASFKF